MEASGDPARNDQALRLFLDHFGLDPGSAPLPLLRSILRVFARLPYENLSKIIADAEAGHPARARRQPMEVLRAHLAHGTGGTCFSLTATLRHLLRCLGFVAEPIMADRPYGPDTHCALAVSIDGRPFLVDPGYLLTEPVPLSAPGEQRIETSFHELRVVPRNGAGKADLYTVNAGRSSLRMTFKTEPVDWGRFLDLWDSSFDWEMMRYPVVTRVTGGRHLYLQGNRLQTRAGGTVMRAEIAPDELATQIAATFGIDAGLVARALSLLRRRGENDGNP